MVVTHRDKTGSLRGTYPFSAIVPFVNNEKLVNTQENGLTATDNFTIEVDGFTLNVYKHEFFYICEKRIDIQ